MLRDIPYRYFTFFFEMGKNGESSPIGRGFQNTLQFFPICHRRYSTIRTNERIVACPHSAVLRVLRSCSTLLFLIRSFVRMSE